MPILTRLKDIGPRRLVLAAALVGFAVVLALLESRFPRMPAAPAAWLDSDDLHGTVVVPTADTPLEAGKSAVWCSSFQVAWSRLRSDVLKGPPAVKGAEEACKRLNEAPETEADLPPGSFYAAAGWAKDGIAEKIVKEMGERFPSVPAPEFSRGSVAIAYAYLEARVPFAIPFFQGRKPLLFRDSSGRETPVASFGIREEDDYANDNLRDQVQVLLCKLDPNTSMERPTEFAIDPCRTSSPVQMVLACVKPGKTLAETVLSTEERLKRPQGLGPTGVLLIPDISFALQKRFQELEDENIGPLFQSIRFRLDRSGTELASEAKVLVRSGPAFFVFDRPFLIYLKKRAGGRPFFAMWVDGPEVLRPF